MNPKIIGGMLVIGIGIFGVYFFSTQVQLPRAVADVLIMVTLLGSLLAGNALIVFGIKKREEPSSKASKKMTAAGSPTPQ